jgi:hypothetical protein
LKTFISAIGYNKKNENTYTFEKPVVSEAVGEDAKPINEYTGNGSVIERVVQCLEEELAALA